MATISTLTAVLELDKSGFESALKEGERDLETFGDKVDSAGSRMQSAGQSLTMGLTAPLAAMGALSARTAANFDQSMQKSIAVMGDVDQAMREKLEERARRVANVTTHSAAQAAESYYFLASAGLDAQQAMAAMPEVAAFAEAGNLRMAEATDVATNVMSAYNYEASQMSEVTDTLTATVSNHNQTMQGMSTAMAKVAPIASSLGISIEETSAAIGQMGDVGIQGERAGTALRNVLSQISDESSPVTKRLEEMGVQTRDAQGNVLSLAEILENMEEAGVEASDAARIFGTEAGPAMAALISEGSGALEQNTQRLREAEGATEEMAQTQRETLNAELQMTRSNLEDVGITIGSQLLPMLSTASGYVRWAAQGFQDLNTGQQRAILVAAGLFAALGPVLMVTGLLAQSVVTLSGAYGVLTGASLGLSGALSGGVVPSALAANVALGPLTVPVWALIAAFAALVAAAGGLYYGFTNNLFGVRDVTTDAFNTVKGWFDSAPGWVLALMGPVGQLYLAWRENLFGIQDIVGNVFEWIGEKIDWLMEYIKKIPGIKEGEGGGLTFDAPEAPEPPEQEMPGSGDMGAGSFPEGMNPEDFESPPTSQGSQPSATPSDLRQAMREQEGGVTADDLGVSQEEFDRLTDQVRGGGGSVSMPTSTGSSSASTEEMMSEISTNSQNTTSRSDVVEKLEAVIEELRSLGGPYELAGGELDVANLDDGVVSIFDGQLRQAGNRVERLGNRQ